MGSRSAGPSPGYINPLAAQDWHWVLCRRGWGNQSRPARDSERHVGGDKEVHWLFIAA